MTPLAQVGRIRGLACWNDERFIFNRSVSEYRFTSPILDDWINSQATDQVEWNLDFDFVQCFVSQVFCFSDTMLLLIHQVRRRSWYFRSAPELQIRIESITCLSLFNKNNLNLDLNLELTIHSSELACMDKFQSECEVKGTPTALCQLRSWTGDQTMDIMQKALNVARWGGIVSTELPLLTPLHSTAQNKQSTLALAGDDDLSKADKTYIHEYTNIGKETEELVPPCWQGSFTYIEWCTSKSEGGTTRHNYTPLRCKDLGDQDHVSKQDNIQILACNTGCVNAHCTVQLFSWTYI